MSGREIFLVATFIRKRTAEAKKQLIGLSGLYVGATNSDKGQCVLSLICGTMPLPRGLTFTPFFSSTLVSPPRFHFVSPSERQLASQREGICSPRI
jgi:hypothetical protein